MNIHWKLWGFREKKIKAAACQEVNSIDNEGVAVHVIESNYGKSGDDNVLKSMNRKYKVKDFLKIVNKFKQGIPDLFLSTDIIVGFPGETEKDFSQSVDLIKQIKLDMLNLSRFWNRKGTEAEKMKHLSVEVIKQRTKRLMDIYKQVKP